MSDARARILGRLRNAQRTARLPMVEAAPPGQPSAAAAPAEPGARDPRESVQRFRAELAALGVDCYVEDSVENLRKRVRSAIDGRRVLSWDPKLLPYEVGFLLRDAVFGQDSHKRQAEAEIGLTGCDAAIAETGSLVLLSAKGKSRTVSLLPPMHLALVRPADVYFGMDEFFRTRGGDLAAAASCTFITGPSRTADIELTLTLGVHGPAQVVVVIGP